MRAPATLPMVWPLATPRRMTGAVELALAEALAGAGARPDRVTAALSAMFETLDGESTPPDTVARLATGTRAWLLALGAAARGAGGWFEADCTACARPFDFPLALKDLPRGPAGPGFPVAEVATSRGVRRFEVPSGVHEAALARGRGDRRALVTLLALDGPEDWDDEDLVLIEEAIDAIAPDVAEEVTCICPA